MPCPRSHNRQSLCSPPVSYTHLKMGVHSLKIEGRTKSFYYCARTAQVYRKAIDEDVYKRQLYTTPVVYLFFDRLRLRFSRKPKQTVTE